MRLALKEIKYNKKNYILIEITIVLLILMVTFLSGLAHGLEKVASSAITEIPQSNFVLNKDAEGAIVSSYIEESVIDNLMEEDPDGEPIVINRGFITKNLDDSKIDVAYFATKEDSKIGSHIIEGKEPVEENTVVLSEAFKDEGFSLGDEIFDKNSELKLTVVGFTETLSYNYTDVAYISEKTQDNMRIAINPKSEIRYTAFLTDKTSLELGEDLDIKSKEDVINKLPGFSAQQKTIVMIIWILIVISASILGVFFYIITIQKQQQYGVMKALGMTTFEISRLLIRQVLVLSFIGVLVGNIFAYGLSFIITSGLPYLVKYEELALISVAFIIISIVSGLISILRISKVDPLEIIGGAK